jgi:hypothetical protein
MNSKRILTKQVMDTQDMKEEINEDRKTLKNNQSEINHSIAQVKISIKS